MNIVFTPTAWEQYTEWQREDKKMVKRINELIKDIDRNGLLTGIGKPEPLKHRKALHCLRKVLRSHQYFSFLYCGQLDHNFYPVNYCNQL